MKRRVAFLFALGLCAFAASCGLPSYGTGPSDEADSGGDDATGALDAQHGGSSASGGGMGKDSTAPMEASAEGDAWSPMEASSPAEASTGAPDAGTPNEASTPDDASSPIDAGGEAASDAAQVVEAGPCKCGTGCSPVQDCSTCPATPYLCGGTCQKDCTQCLGASFECSATGSCAADCTACAGSPIECFACSSNMPVGPGPANTVLSTCGALNTSSFCIGGYATYTSNPQPYVHHCGCPHGAADCPGANQVCNPSVGCQSCGEVTSGGEYGTNQYEMCKGGGMCDPMTGTCQ